MRRGCRVLPRLIHLLLNLSAQLSVVLFTGPVMTGEAAQPPVNYKHHQLGEASAQGKPITVGPEATGEAWKHQGDPVAYLESYFSEHTSTFISFGFFCPTLNFLSLHPTEQCFYFIAIL